MPPIVAALIAVVVVAIALALLSPRASADDLPPVHEPAPVSPAVTTSSPTEADVVPPVGPPALYATFPRRLNALSADAVILILFSIGVFVILPDGVERAAIRLSLAFVWWAVLLFYEPAMVTWFGGTLGHRLLNLRVVDDKSGTNPTFSKALGRLVVKGVLGIFSFLSMSFSRRHQALHDMATGTTVQVRDPAKAARHHYVTMGTKVVALEDSPNKRMDLSSRDDARPPL